MKRSTHTHRKLVKRIALGLAIGAIAVPAAQAQTYSTGPPAAGGASATQPAIPTDGPRSGPSAPSCATRSPTRTRPTRRAPARRWSTFRRPHR